MKNKDWNQIRSDFSHSWLKNRLILTLRKANNVVAGFVSDDTIWNDLLRLLSEWTDRRNDALIIINEYLNEANPANELNKLPIHVFDPDVYNWLWQVVNKSWLATSNPTSKINLALLNFEAFDQEAQSFKIEISSMPSGQNPQVLEDKLTSFQEKANQMATAFSRLVLTEY